MRAGAELPACAQAAGARGSVGEAKMSDRNRDLQVGAEQTREIVGSVVRLVEFYVTRSVEQIDVQNQEH
jgi:hypothetical protein